MQKQITEFKTVIQGIESYFHFDQNCPIGVAKEAILECLKWLGSIEDAIKAAQEAQKASENQSSETPAETPPVEDSQTPAEAPNE